MTDQQHCTALVHTRRNLNVHSKGSSILNICWFTGSEETAETAAEARSSDDGGHGNGEIGGGSAAPGGAAIDPGIAAVTKALSTTQTAAGPLETASSWPRTAPPKPDPWDLWFTGPDFDAESDAS